MKKLMLMATLFVVGLCGNTVFALVDDGDPVIINVGYCVTPDLVDDALESAKSILLKGDFGATYHFHLVHTPDVTSDDLSGWDELVLYFDNVKVFEHSFDAEAAVSEYTDQEVDLARVLALYVPEIIIRAEKQGIQGSLKKKHFKDTNNFLRQKYRLLLLNPKARIRKPIRELFSKQMSGCASSFVIAVSQTDCGKRSLENPDLIKTYKYLGYKEEDLGMGAKVESDKTALVRISDAEDLNKKNEHSGVYPGGLCIDYFDSQVLVLHLGRMLKAGFSERAMQFVSEKDCWGERFDELAYNYISRLATDEEEGNVSNARYLSEPEDQQWNTSHLGGLIESAAIVMEADVLESLDKAKAKNRLPEPFWKDFEYEKKAGKSKYAEKGKYLAAEAFVPSEETPVVEEIFIPIGGNEEVAPVVEEREVEVVDVPEPLAHEEENVAPEEESNEPVIEEIFIPIGGNEEVAPVVTPVPTPVPTQAPVATPVPTPVPTQAPVSTPVPAQPQVPAPVATPVPTPKPAPVATPVPAQPQASRLSFLNHKTRLSQLTQAEVDLVDDFADRIALGESSLSDLSNVERERFTSILYEIEEAMFI